MDSICHTSLVKFLSRKELTIRERTVSRTSEWVFPNKTAATNKTVNVWHNTPLSTCTIKKKHSVSKSHYNEASISCLSVWYVTLILILSTTIVYVHLQPDLEFSRLESWSRDVSRPVFTSLGLGLGLGTSESWSWNPRVSVSVLEPQSLGFGLGTLESRFGLGLGTCDHEDLVFVTHEAWNCPPATSAPAERIFSHSGLLMGANRVRMGDKMLSQLVYLRCNNKL